MEIIQVQETLQYCTGRLRFHKLNIIVKQQTSTHCPTITTATTTVLRPFIRDYPGEPVTEETFTHSHLSWSTTTRTRTTTTTTILRPFVRVYPGEPVPEETFTDSHPSWSLTILYLLPPSTMIHRILHVQSFCTTSLQVLFGQLRGLAPTTYLMNRKKWKQSLVASYKIWPGNREELIPTAPGAPLGILSESSGSYDHSEWMNVNSVTSVK